MKGFTMPRLDAVSLTSYFRARSIDRLRRNADTADAFRVGIDRDDALRDRIRHADPTPSFTSVFWILHAR